MHLDLADYRGQTLLIHNEKGLGDTLQFIHLVE